MLHRRLLTFALLMMAGAIMSPSLRVAVHAGQVAWPVAGPTEYGRYALDLSTGKVIRESGANNSVAWSPDDSMLATTGPSVTILTVDSGVSSIVPGTDTEWVNPGGPNGPPIPHPQGRYVSGGPVRWSPDGGFLAFIGTPPGDAVPPSLVVYRIGDTQTRRLESYFNGTYIWTPDSRFLTVLSGGPNTIDGKATVKNVDPRTGAATTLLTSAGSDRLSAPSWSAGGDYLAYSGQAGIWIYAVATDASSLVYEGGHGAMKWADDDTLLVEVYEAPQVKLGEPLPFSLQRFERDGSAASVVVESIPDPDATPPDAAFDTASGVVVYTAKDCRAGTASTWLVDQGSTPRQVSVPAAYASESRLSPDGAAIASIVLASDGAKLMLESLDGGPARTLLTTSKALTNPWWSAGGRWLSFEVTRSGYKDCRNS